VTAIDISEVFIAHAQKAEEQNPLGIDYRVASAVELPFASSTFDFLFFLPAGVRGLCDLFRAPINLLGFCSKRHAMIGLFLADSDLYSLFALPQNQLQKVAQPGIALSTFRSTGSINFADGFIAF
jgi:Methyltransferase domain